MITFKKLNCNPSGNPRKACHYFHLLTKHEKVGGKLYKDFEPWDDYKIALNRAKLLGECSRKYNNKSFGGGISFTTFLDDYQLEKAIVDLVESEQIKQTRSLLLK